MRSINCAFCARTGDPVAYHALDKDSHLQGFPRQILSGAQDYVIRFSIVLERLANKCRF